MNGGRLLAHGKHVAVLAVIAWSATWACAASAEETSPELQLLAAVQEADLPEVRRLLKQGAYKPTTFLGIVTLGVAKSGSEEVHAEMAALLQAELDDHLQSGELTESFLGTRRLLERLDEPDFKAGRRQVGGRFRDCPKCPEMTVLPTGTFEMGSPSTEQRRLPWEGPLHGVAIEVPVAMSSHEVTVSEFTHFAADTGHSTGDACWTFDMSFSELLEWSPDTAMALRQGVGAVRRAGKGWRSPGFDQSGRHPVVCVSWNDARAYAQWLSGQTGESYRLPSEAEWEYAARAGTNTATYWGDASADACRHMNGGGIAGAETKAQASGESTDPLACRDDYRHSSTAGSFEPNAFGLYDMLGNAWEWTADCANTSYRYAPSDGSAWEGGHCSERAVRGGSYRDLLFPARSALRKFLRKDIRVADVGFRVVRSMRTDSFDAGDRTNGGQARESEREIGDRFRDCPGCPEMVVVPAGSFEMGSRRGEKGRYRDEGPVRDVKIADRIAVGVYEVNRAEFARFVGQAQYTTGGACEVAFLGRRTTVGEEGWRSPGLSQRRSHPVVCVDWHDARAYAQWLSGRTGKTYRLPSEAEWEYVARGGSTGLPPWSSSERRRSGHSSWARQCAYANGADRSFADQVIAHSESGAVEQVADLVSELVASCEDWHATTSPVGSYRSNDFGMHDMIGNAYEWTEDCWNRNYRRAPTDGRPRTAGDCQYRVVRGGSYLSGWRMLRPANRAAWRATDKLATVGFRVVRSLAADPDPGRSAERD